MSFKDTINEELKTAMKAKDQGALRALRAIKSAILLAETAEGRASGPLTDEEAMKLVTKQAKQRRESIAQFKANNREDLVATEEEELVVLDRFLPKQMSESEIKAEVELIISETGASSMKDMGKVMGIASKKMVGKADGKIISGMVRQLLA